MVWAIGPAGQRWLLLLVLWLCHRGRFVVVRGLWGLALLCGLGPAVVGWVCVRGGNGAWGKREAGSGKRETGDR